MMLANRRLQIEYPQHGLEARVTIVIVISRETGHARGGRGAEIVVTAGTTFA